MTVKQIERELLKLDARSRAKLAKRLLHSLDELSEVENERLWAQEALRRHEDLRKGEAKTLPMDEVFRQARARVK
jgi:putative addiction module component (TIGR02574 family)